MVGILMAHVGREFAGSRTLRPHVYRREACPVHFCHQFTGFLQTEGRSVTPRCPPVLVRPEFRADVQTRRRSVPAHSIARTRGARVYAGPESSERVRTQASAAPALTRADIAEACKLDAGVCPGPGSACTHPGRHCGIVQARAGRVAPRGPPWQEPRGV